MTADLTADAATTNDGDWSIDDLARRADMSVDTIRYYQREGMLPAGARNGRTLRYGSKHLEQLEQIRRLQARRFSLAAIRALLEHKGTLEALLDRDPPTGARYEADDLAAAAGMSPELFARLQRSGFLRPPAELGLEGYDNAEVAVLKSLHDLSTLGVPDDVLVEFAVVVAERFDQLQRAAIGLFTTRSNPAWTDEAIERFDHGKAEEPRRVTDDMRAVLTYVQLRTYPRIVLDELCDEPRRDTSSD